jgi:cell division protein FtsL
MDIYEIVILAFIVVAIAIREIYIQKKFKQMRITISTLLFIISEDPEKFEKVMQDIYNINGLEEVE